MGDEPNVFLYNIDDLQQIVDDNLGRRRAELPARRVDHRPAGWRSSGRWYSGLAVVPTIRDLRARGEALRPAEVEKALRRLAPPLRGGPRRRRRAVARAAEQAPPRPHRAPAARRRGTAAAPRCSTAVRYLFELDDARQAAEREEPTRAAPTK